MNFSVSSPADRLAHRLESKGWVRMSSAAVQFQINCRLGTTRTCVSMPLGRPQGGGKGNCRSENVSHWPAVVHSSAPGDGRIY